MTTMMEAFIVPTQKFPEVYALIDASTGVKQAKFAFIRTLELQVAIRRGTGAGTGPPRVRCFHNAELGKWEVSEIL